jgi:hypothetical protein
MAVLQVTQNGFNSFFKITLLIRVYAAHGFGQDQREGSSGDLLAQFEQAKSAKGATMTGERFDDQGLAARRPGRE